MTSRQRAQTLLLAGLVCWLAAQSQAQTYSMKALGVGAPYQIGIYSTPGSTTAGRLSVTPLKAATSTAAVWSHLYPLDLRRSISTTTA